MFINVAFVEKKSMVNIDTVIIVIIKLKILHFVTALFFFATRQLVIRQAHAA